MQLYSVSAVIEKFDNFVLVQRGVVKLRIEDKNNYSIVKTILNTAKTPQTKQGIIGTFQGNEQENAKEIIDILLINRFLVEFDQHAVLISQENSQDVYYWHFRRNNLKIQDGIKNRKIAIIGLNELSLEVRRQLLIAGFNDIAIFKNSLLDNTNITDDSIFKENALLEYCPDIVIGSAPNCQERGLIEINKICIENKIICLPLFVNNISADIGPLIIPHETACYNCVLLRSKSNQSQHFEIFDRSSENFNDKNMINGWLHCTLAAVSASTTMLLINFFSQLYPITFNVIIEICLIKQESISRNVVRVPSCTVCAG